VAALHKLFRDDELRELVLRGLSDRADAAQALPTEMLVAALRDVNPRVRAVAAAAAGRLGRNDAASALVERAEDGDRIVSHLAINALADLKAAEVCFAKLDDSSLSLGHYAAVCRALQGMHEAKVVDGLLERLPRVQNEMSKRAALLSALCRLAKREDKWDGKWWGTRPDTTGPYYYPVDWSETPRILAALESARDGGNDDQRLWLTIEALRNRVTLPDAVGDIVRRGERDSAFRPEAIRILGKLPELNADADRLLFSTAQDVNLPADQRAAALGIVAKRADKTDSYPAALAAFATVGIGNVPEPLANVRNDFFKSASGGKQFKVLTEAVASSDSAVRRLALNMLLNVVQDEKSKQDRRDEANRAIEQAWKSPAGTIDLLNAVAAADADLLADRVQALRKSDDAAIRDAAEFAAKELRLDARAKDAKTIAQFTFDEVQSKLSGAKGDLKRGAKLFVKQGCVNCHAVSPSEPPKGPFLGGIAARYKRHELIESVLKPSHKIAQGFETQYFVTDDGLLFEGFVVRESGDEVELRNANGVATVVKKKSVEERGRRELSVMPTGLADRLTLDDLAGLLAYLESLPGK
jgi:putative heme-binding domain-containing protein